MKRLADRLLSLLRTRKHPGTMTCAATVLAASFAVPFAARGETYSQKQEKAKSYIREALYRGVYGEVEGRDQLLQSALQLAPNQSAAQWHQGRLRMHRKWVSVDEVPQIAADDLRLRAYQKKRDEAPDTVEGQLKLADWCRKELLADQERAHLTRVVELDMDHAEARGRLGFRRVDGQWRSEEELASAQAERQQRARDLKQWQRRIEQLAHNLENASTLGQKVSTERIRQIDDPRAIAALESILAPSSEEAGLLAVEVLDRFSQSDASLALARVAVFSRWEKVRQSATERLTRREEESFIPDLLDALSTPIESRQRLYRGRGGRLVYQMAVYREGKDERQLAILDTAYRRNALPGGDGAQTLSRALADIRQTAAERQREIERRNEQSRQLNERIGQVLASVTDQSAALSPEQWWSWWDSYNEVYVEGEKKLRQSYSARQVSISDQVPIPTGTGSGGLLLVSGGSGSGTSLDCLAAGTSIWTELGAVAVEKLQRGDRVLAQDPETGELAYKPVLRTTVRPESELTTITAGGQTIAASGGHFFWILGRGWVRARDVEAGMYLHGATAAVRVDQVGKREKERTYNLIVADFNSYFVGDGKVLSHDNTIREPTAAIVPGLVE